MQCTLMITLEAGDTLDHYRLDAKMVCFRCFDGSQPESARALLQAFDRACERGIVLKSCNEPLPGAVGL